MASWRPESVGREIREILSDLIRTRLKDPRLGFVTVTDVKMTRDLRSARVYVSVMGEGSGDETLEVLLRAAPFLRRELGSRLQLRHVPELTFQYDDSIERGTRINAILDGLDQGG